MVENFGNSVRDVTPEYRAELETSVSTHLLGTYQKIRLMDQQGTFGTKSEPVTGTSGSSGIWLLRNASRGPGICDCGS
jgi:hypothetical protein